MKRPFHMEVYVYTYVWSGLRVPRNPRYSEFDIRYNEHRQTPSEPHSFFEFFDFFDFLDFFTPLPLDNGTGMGEERQGTCNHAAGAYYRALEFFILRPLLVMMHGISSW